jgi:hypothetical protein
MSDKVNVLDVVPLPQLPSSLDPVFLKLIAHFRSLLKRNTNIIFLFSLFEVRKTLKYRPIKQETSK